MAWGPFTARGRAARQVQRRLAQAETVPPGPVRDLLLTPTQSPQTPATELRLLAVDLETTGLDPSTDRILSIGWVPVDGLEISLAGAGQVMCRTEGEVGQSAVIHGITDDDLARGIPLAEAVEQVAEALRGRHLLAHHSPLETGFLNRASTSTHGVDIVAAAVDTMQLQARVLDLNTWREPPAGALRLSTARAHLGLPRYTAHEALTDALACAELYLAQVARLGAGTDLASLRSRR